MDHVLQIGPKPHQLLLIIGQINILQKNVCADFFDNIEEFTLYQAENSPKFA